MKARRIRSIAILMYFEATEEASFSPARRREDAQNRKPIDRAMKRGWV